MRVGTILDALGIVNLELVMDEVVLLVVLLTSKYKAEPVIPIRGAFPSRAEL